MKYVHFSKGKPKKQWNFQKAFLLTISLFLIALKPRGLLLSLPPEKEGKESAKGGIMFPPFEPLTKAAAAGLLRKPGKYAGSKWAALPAQIAVIPGLYRSPNFSLLSNREHIRCFLQKEKWSGVGAEERWRQQAPSTGAESNPYRIAIKRFSGPFLTSFFWASKRRKGLPRPERLR